MHMVVSATFLNLFLKMYNNLENKVIQIEMGERDLPSDPNGHSS